jgi:hypothetical protein
MISHILGRISKLGPIMGSLVTSAVGCFVVRPGFRLGAMDEEGLDREVPGLADGRSLGLSIGIGAAIFLMVFIASEALATIAALRR